MSHMLLVRDRPKHLQWHVLKYEDFMSDPELVTIHLLGFLGVEPTVQVMERCRNAAKQDSQEGSILSRQKLKGVSGYLPDNFTQVVNDSFLKFGLPTLDIFDTMFR